MANEKREFQMKLKNYRVKEFKSIWDSGPIKVDEKTCLVGKNEAGKTALLTALYRTNPITPSDVVFNTTYDYPKREVTDYENDVENKKREEVCVVHCQYELETEDKQNAVDMFGDNVFKSDDLHTYAYYGENRSDFLLKIDEKATIQFLAENQNLTEELKKKLCNSQDWGSFHNILGTEEQTGAVKQIKDISDRVVASGDLSKHIYNSIIGPNRPKFFYFDDYYQMIGRENLNSLLQRQKNNQLRSSDRPLLGLIKLARLDPSELLNSNNTTALKNKLENASNQLTNKIMKYWSQNQHIQMRFDIREAKSEDPEGMQSGVNIWGDIYDTVHLSSTPLGSRSRGFVWFFSFLAWYEYVKKDNPNIILLLDEPGLSLHGKAQGDLLHYFDEELVKQHQLIYSTHSPFMIDPKHFKSVRIVQDRGIDTRKQLPRDQDGTKVLTDAFNATNDSLFPLQGALGYEIQQTLFIGPNSLVVEGPSDLLFLTSMSDGLEREGRTGLSKKWVITPVGGSGKVSTFVSLLSTQKGMKVATLLDQESDQQYENLYKKKLLNRKNIFTYADFLEKSTADIEDLFDREFYIKLVNLEFQKELSNPIDLSQINEREPRTLKAIEEYLKKNPMSFGDFSHYRPARYFSEHINDLWSEISDSVKKRFEKIAEEFNKLIK